MFWVSGLYMAFRKLKTFLANNVLAEAGTPAARLESPMTVTPADTDGLVVLGTLDVSARRRGHVDDDRTFGHVAEHFRANQPRRRFAGNQRGRDGEIGFGELFGHGFLLAFLIGGGGFSGVTAVVFEIFLIFDVDETGAERFNLFLNRRSDVRGIYLCAETFGCGNGLKSGNAGA